MKKLKFSITQLMYNKFKLLKKLSLRKKQRKQPLKKRMRKNKQRRRNLLTISQKNSHMSLFTVFAVNLLRQLTRHLQIRRAKLCKAYIHQLSLVMLPFKEMPSKSLWPSYYLNIFAILLWELLLFCKENLSHIQRYQSPPHHHPKRKQSTSTKERFIATCALER